MKKIVFISLMNSSPWGGSEELWAATANEALNAGHEVLVSVFDWGKIPLKLIELKQAGAIVVLRKRSNEPISFFRKLSRKVRRLFKKSYEEYREIKEFSPDFICINQGGSYDFLYDNSFCKYITNIRVPFFLICQYNNEIGVLREELRIEAVKIFKKARHIFFVSERNKLTCQRQLIDDLRDSSVVFNPLNISDPQYIAYPISETIQFACVARLDCNYKGQDILLQVLSGESWKNRNWVLNMYGSGKDKEFLTLLAGYFGINHKVIFHDFVSDIKKVWSENQILLLPSIGEGTPLSLIEAMICGRTAIVTDVGGNADYIIEGFTGYVAESSSVKYFGAAMERAWNSRNNWMMFGEKANELICEKIDFNPGKTLRDRILSLA